MSSTIRKFTEEYFLAEITDETFEKSFGVF